jgi:hypothetical protein
MKDNPRPAPLYPVLSGKPGGSFYLPRTAAGASGGGPQAACTRLRLLQSSEADCAGKRPFVPPVPAWEATEAVSCLDRAPGIGEQSFFYTTSGGPSPRLHLLHLQANPKVKKLSEQSFS